MTDQPTDLSEEEGLSEDALDHVVAAFSALLEGIRDRKMTTVEEVENLAEGLIMKALSTMNTMFGGISVLETLKLMEEGAPNVHERISKKITIVRVNPATGEGVVDV